jgi:hypothetical protein
MTMSIISGNIFSEFSKYGVIFKYDYKGVQKLLFHISASLYTQEHQIVIVLVSTLANKQVFYGVEKRDFKI